jgi:hypothetical protein
VKFTAPGINTNLPGGAFLPGINTPEIIVISDDFGFAPPLTDQDSIFQANPFVGSYVVSATADVSFYTLTLAFNMTNIQLGDTCGASATTASFVNSNQLILNQSFSSRGTYSVVVANPAPGGGVSNEIEFQVTDGAISGIPTIRTDNPISPQSVRARSAGFNLQVFRDTTTDVLFHPTAWVNFGTVRLDRIAGDTNPDVMTVSVPSFLVGSAGIVPVSVTNPGVAGNTGGTSTRVFFQVAP